MIGLGLSVSQVAVRQSGSGTPTPTPTPAPSFTTQPSISPSSGNVGNTYTASDGVASNSTGFTRRWLLGVTQIGTGTTVVPVTSGSLTLEVTATGPGGSTVATSTAVTVSAGTMPNYRVALANAKNGTTGPLIINVIGDSTVAGSGGGTGTPATLIANNPRINGAINQQLATAFAASGLSKNGADIFGGNFPVGTQTAADYAAWNTSVTPGSWTLILNVVTSIGGNIWNSQASGANFSWTAEGRQFDKLVVYYVTNGTLGQFRIRIDGVAQTTINTATAGGIGRVQYTPTIGTHTVEIEWVSGSAYVIGMETQDTTTKASVRIRNLGLGSTKSGDIIDKTAAWKPGFALETIDAASLHIIEGGVINDWLSSTAVATVSSNLTTMMTQATNKGGDVLLLGPTRSNPATTAAATQQTYVDAMAALANGTTRAFYDLKTGVGDYAAMTAASRMFDTVTHPNAAGYAAEAAAVYGAIS